MKQGERWLLPDGVDEFLPPHAVPLEQLRRDILDLLMRWGYELVIPPLIEFLESLQSENGEDLNLQTFKITDQVTGRLMGIRADITPQVARIDAHRLPTDLPQRLCYLGPVLHTKPDKFAGSRNPLQLGAELSGHSGIESDAEIISVMADVLKLAGLAGLTIELGHMGVFKALADTAGLDPDAADKLLDALVRKTEYEVAETLDQNNVDGTIRQRILGLLSLNGGVEVVNLAKKVLAGAPPLVGEAIESLDGLVGLLADRIPGINLHVDLAELRGYRYHTGVIFAAYVPGEGRAIAWGGRYDNIGSRFGRRRAATGFSTDLKTLITARRYVPESRPKIFAPAGRERALIEAIAEFRRNGMVVIQELPGQRGGARELGCTSILVHCDGAWQVQDMDN